MNKRIFELLKQATTDVNPEDREWVFSRVDQAKFAELIVKECLKIVEPDQTSGDEWCVTLDETAQSIRQHFGVEE
jgi:hypothetical protein